MNIHNTFVIADTHFGHENMHLLRLEAGIGGYSCQTVRQMDEMLIDNWNSVVSPKDEVIVLGDFAWREKDFENLMRILNGTKTLVIGNHDTRNVRKSPLWKETGDIIRLRLGEEDNSPKSEKVDIYCCHYPLRSWNRTFHGSFHLYGHTHAADMRDRREFNAGVDVEIDPYKPRSLANVLAAMAPRWFPKRGGCPLDDYNPCILQDFAHCYGASIDLKKIIEEQQSLDRKNMFDMPLGG